MRETRPLMDPWRDAFLLRLRLHDVTGTAIGDALAQVDAHCAESGEDPEQAFGEVGAYADSLVDLLPRSTPTRAWQSAALAGGTVLGVEALLSGVDGAVHAVPARLTVGSLVVAVVVAGGTVLIVRNLERLLGGERRWALGLVFALAVGIAAAAPVLVPGTVVSASGAVLAVGGVLVLAGVWLPWLGGRRLTGSVTSDRVIDPRTGREPFVAPRWAGYAAWALPSCSSVRRWR